MLPRRGRIPSWPGRRFLAVRITPRPSNKCASTSRRRGAEGRRCASLCAGGVGLIAWSGHCGRTGSRHPQAARVLLVLVVIIILIVVHIERTGHLRGGRRFGRNDD